MSVVTAPRAASVPLLVLIVGGCLLAVVGNGVRTSLGLFTLPMTTDLGLSRESWGLAFAIQNLAWGVAQPFIGAIADRHGTARVVFGGLLVYAAGIALMAVSHGALVLDLTAGIVVGVGLATSSYSLIMQAFGRNVPQEKRALIFGVATAASSLGQFLFAPISQGFISSFGWQSALIYLAGILVLVAPLTFALRGRSNATATAHADMPLMATLRRALAFRSYRLLIMGFFVCGFHIAFVSVHMPAYLVQCGLPPAIASWSLAVIGLFNVVGSLFSGYLGGRLPKQFLLASIYFARALAIGLFVLLPVTEASALIFSAVLGLLWLSTIPLTAGLVTGFFGARYMGLLYGLVFLSHQLGSFMGVWLGGVVFDLTGNYSLMWYLSILLGLGSAAIHLPIRDTADKSFAIPVAA